MRLGTETVSLVNHIHSLAVRGQPDPVEGMGATVLAYTDRYPATIISVNSDKRVMLLVREDKATRTDQNGLSECQSYAFEPNPEGQTWTFRQAKNGTWEEVRRNRETGRWIKVNGAGLRIGERNKYHDFSF